MDTNSKLMDYCSIYLTLSADWLFDGESKIFTANDAINVTDGSVLVRSDLSLRDVKLRSLEGVHMSDFLNDIFIRGERQVIKGKAN